MDIRHHQPDESSELFQEYSRIEEVKKYISENIDGDLSVSVFSEKFELSISSLQHLFKKYEKQSYRYYLEEARMEKAFLLITKKGKRIKEAMYSSGYHNRVTFNIAFKKKFTFPPSHFSK